jgi:hypothetical protein
MREMKIMVGKKSSAPTKKKSNKNDITNDTVLSSAQLINAANEPLCITSMIMRVNSENALAVKANNNPLLEGFMLETR